MQVILTNYDNYPNNNRNDKNSRNHADRNFKVDNHLYNHDDYNLSLHLLLSVFLLSP